MAIAAPPAQQGGFGAVCPAAQHSAASGQNYGFCALTCLNEHTVIYHVCFRQHLLLLNVNLESGVAAELGLLLLVQWETLNLFCDQVIFRALLLVVSGLTEN